MIFDVIDECFNYQENNPDNTADAEKWIEDAANFHMEMMGAISQAKSKAEFKPIYAAIEEKQKTYVEALNALQ